MVEVGERAPAQIERARTVDIGRHSPKLAARWTTLGIEAIARRGNETLGHPSALSRSPAWAEGPAAPANAGPLPVAPGPFDELSDEAAQALERVGAGIVALGARIAAGGMGEVLAAEQLHLRRAVAVKRALPGADADTRDAMLREAWITAALEHPNILPIHRLGRDGNEPLIVMQRVHGAPWSDTLEARSDATDEAARDEALETLIEVCRAVHFAHTRGVLHLDLKPENVMVGAHGEVLLLDWGIAVAHDPSLAPPFVMPARAVDGIRGTPGYLSPEQAAADGERFGPATDVYLLGAILHEILTGEPPHGGTLIEALVSAFAAETPRYPGHVPPELARIAQRALAARPTDRFESVDGLRRALADFLAHRPAVALLARADTLHGEIDAALALRAERGDEEALDDAISLASKIDACRFAYVQAQRFWPESREAEAGLSRLLDALLVRAEERLDVDAARAWVETHPRRDAALDARFARLVDAAAREEARDGELRALSLDENTEHRADTRVGLAVGGGVAWFVWNLVAWALDRSGIMPMTIHSLLSLCGAALALFTGMLAVQGFDAVAASAANRRVAWIIYCAFASCFVLFLDGAMRSMDPHVITVLAHAVYFTAFAAVAALVDARTWWVPIAILIPSALGALQPEHVLLWSAFLGPLCGYGMVRYWRRPREAQPA